MRTRKALSIAALALGLSIMAAPIQASASGSPAVRQVLLAAPDPARLPSAAIVVPEDAVLFVTASSTATTHTVTGLYAQPDSSGAVLSWVMPGTSLRLLGLSADNAFWAIAAGSASTEVAGWMRYNDLSSAPAQARAAALTKVYRQRDASSAVADVLAPGQAIALLGSSRDGKWSAVVSGSSIRTVGWIRSSDLRQNYGTAQIRGLTKAYVQPDDASRVFDVLTPWQLAAVLGRSRDGAWLAVASQDGRIFRGWVRAGDVQYGESVDALPIVSAS